MTCSKPISDETQLKVDAALLCDTVWKLLIKFDEVQDASLEVHTYHAKKLKPSSFTCCDHRLYRTQGFRWKFQDKGTNLNFSLHQTCLEAEKNMSQYSSQNFKVVALVGWVLQNPPKKIT